MSLRLIIAKYDGKCHECHRTFDEGDEVLYDCNTSWLYHTECGPEEEDANPHTGRFSANTDGYRKPQR